MFLKWMRPVKFYRTVDVYHVFYRKEDDKEWEEQVVETVNNTFNHMVSAWGDFSRPFHANYYNCHSIFRKSYYYQWRMTL